MPDDGSLADQQMSGREIVTTALTLLRANYVFPELAEQAAVAVEARLESGEYDDLDEITLTELLTTHLQEVCDDKHLRVRLGGGPMRHGPGPALVPALAPARGPGPGPGPGGPGPGPGPVVPALAPARVVPALAPARAVPALAPARRSWSWRSWPRSRRSWSRPRRSWPRPSCSRPQASARRS